MGGRVGVFLELNALVHIILSILLKQTCQVFIILHTALFNSIVRSAAA